MRITNKIMQNNSIGNINTNKLQQDKLNTQMATGKKLTRPSDDPVVAIRSLRLSSNVTKLEQYNEKNAEDASKWLSVTEDAIDGVTDVIRDMYAQCERGAGDDMNTSNYKAILEQLNSLRDEVYAGGNADYAGRSLFTGFRTEDTLTFTKDDTRVTKITQEFTIDDIKKETNIELNDVMQYTPATGFTGNETDITGNSYSRIRLAYDNLASDGSNLVLSYVDETGTTKTESFAPKLSTDADVYSGTGSYYLYDTGELIIPAAMENDLSSQPLGTKFTVTYEKDDWKKGELKPEHYFDCEITEIDVNGNSVPVKYRAGSTQAIEYDLGSNQSMRVNTTADEVFKHDIGRDVDDISVMINRLADVEGILDDINKQLPGLAGADYDKAVVEKAAVLKASVLLKDQLQKKFGETMTKMQGYQDSASVAMTNIGARGARLDLVVNRLSSSQDTFKELLASNDEKSIEESATELAGADLAYKAALSATSKILQTSLMDYI